MGVVMLNDRQYNTILKGFEEGGGSLPTFSETLICDNTAESTGTITFTDDYENYDLLVFEVHFATLNMVNTFLTIPEAVSHIISISNGNINFGSLESNQYVTYTPSQDHLTWNVFGRNNTQIVTVKGLTCTNGTVTKTTFYERADRTIGTVNVEPAQNLSEYDFIFLASTSGGQDETQVCYPPILVDKSLIDYDYQYRGNFFTYGTTVFPANNVTIIGNHSIQTLYNSQPNNTYLAGAYGIKFT